MRTVCPAHYDEPSDQCRTCKHAAHINANRRRKWKLENALSTLGYRLFWDKKLPPEKRRRLERTHENLAHELYGLDD